MQAPLPGNETERLRALHATCLLDSEPEERFDRLTRLARQLFCVPYAFVSLVDQDRQWFKSGDIDGVVELPRSESICAHAILDKQMLICEDLCKDTRFADMAAVKGAPGLRFYAGAPLVLEGQYSIGTLSIVSTSPRRFTAEDITALKDLAACVVDEIALLRERELRHRLFDQDRLSAVINRIQAQQIRYADFNKTFGTLIKDILQLIDADFGMICDVTASDGRESMALSVRVVSSEGQVFFPDGQAIPNLNRLFYQTLVSRQAMIVNQVAEDPCPFWRERGFPQLRNYLGIPVMLGGKPVTMLVLGNRRGSFDRDTVQFLQPLLFTLAQLVQASAVREQKREIQSEILRLSQVASQTTNGVVITDIDGRVRWINEGFSRLAGYTLEEIKGLSPGRILQGEESDRRVADQMARAVKDREPFDVELINYHKSGRPYWVHISCNPLLNESSELEGFIAIESDITDRKRLENVKDQFIANVSHELKTPLTALNGALSLMQSQSAGVPVDKLLDMAARNGRRLALLIDDLLDTERLMQGKVNLELADYQIVPLLEQAVADNKPAMADRAVQLVLNLAGNELGRQAVRVDQLRFHQVINNLISNAIKFSPHNEPVTVTASVHDSHCKISVTDHGPGVPDNFRPHIFKRFSQAEIGSRREHGGAGLGLAISKELVEQMQGEIGFDSVPGKCHFYFTVPLSEK
ncbi:ATP-binding protein [Pseudohongiella spirulinae]|uniref:histidine kinase n=1 Tax=Pseudohongiella spirulinae TaxID=1249552 RepID=A0A0S2KEY8_9GAMM|nr:ATP-binding protein [Pseudohongiella spirulinae]ALO46891.1 Putative Two-component hybrid sensor and regulator [Pseudohongiella spirulinae]